jgi:hypothetical protein
MKQISAFFSRNRVPFTSENIFREKRLFGFIKYLLIFAILSSTTSAFGFTVPPFDHDEWTKDNRLSKNNCYNYATNTFTEHFAQPGKAFFNEEYLDTHAVTHEQMAFLVALDGLVGYYPEYKNFLVDGINILETSIYPMGKENPGGCPFGGALILLAVGFEEGMSGSLFHFYRRDLNYYENTNEWKYEWSHKNGYGHPTQDDYYGNKLGEYIEDDELLVHPNSPIYRCAYFCTYSDPDEGSNPQGTGIANVK